MTFEIELTQAHLDALKDGYCAIVVSPSERHRGGRPEVTSHVKLSGKTWPARKGILMVRQVLPDGGCIEIYKQKGLWRGRGPGIIPIPRGDTAPEETDIFEQ